MGTMKLKPSPVATPEGKPPVAPRGLDEIQTDFSREVSIYGGLQFQIRDLESKLPAVVDKLFVLRAEFDAFIAAQNEKAKAAQPNSAPDLTTP